MFADFLIRVFVRNYKEVQKSEVRSRYGVLSGITGIICNFLLAMIKLVTGLLTGAFSIAADAVNNLSDTVSSIITLAGFKISNKSADKEHPYGHGRAEYLAGFVVSAAVIAVALELLKTSIEHIIHKNQMDVSITTIIILVCTILVKCWMSYFYFKVSKRINSAAMRATATDSLADCVTTGVALASVIVMLVLGKNIDGIAGAIVSVLVIISGFSTAMETIHPLIGESPDTELVKALKETAFAQKEILGVHAIRIHEYGPGHRFVTMDVELSCTYSMNDAHDIITRIENDIKQKGLANEATIHLDPVVMGDAERESLLSLTNRLLEQIDSESFAQDFRIHKQDNKKWLEFDVVLPYNSKIPDDEFCNRIQYALGAHCPGFESAVIHILKE